MHVFRASARSIGRYTLVCFLAGAACSSIRQTASAADRPNIVLLMADDQGYGDVAYRGHETLKTPVLDEMAASGLRFDHFYAAAPVCSPTRGSVLTGRHPNRFACFSWGHDLRPQEVTVAEALKSVGYTTGHFGKWHLGSVRAGDATSPGRQGFDEWVSSPNFYENSPLLSDRGKVIRTEGEGSQVTVDAALKFIGAAAERQQPFLAVVWFGSPHGPHIGLPEDLKRYAEQAEKLAHYYAEITAMDRAVGKLRGKLRDLKIADNTLVWYTSDNGATTPGSTGGLRGQKASLWEGGIRVPAIIEWPARIKSPAVCGIPCCSVDIYPTLLAITGVSIPRQPPLDGISLLGILDGQAKERTRPLGFWVYPRPGKGVRSAEILQALAKENALGEGLPTPPIAAELETFSEQELPGHAAWVDNRYKLHRIASRSGEVVYELYDLVDDPRETRNVASQQPERVTKMKAALADWQQSVVRSLNGRDYATKE